MDRARTVESALTTTVTTPVKMPFRAVTECGCVAVPPFSGTLSPAEQAQVSAAKAKNRRIAIEDQVVSRPKEAAF